MPEVPGSGNGILLSEAQYNIHSATVLTAFEGVLTKEEGILIINNRMDEAFKSFKINPNGTNWQRLISLMCARQAIHSME